MASHLTIIGGPGGASASARAFSGQQPGAQDATNEPGGLLGLFAALLGKATGNAGTPAVTSPATGEGKSELDLAGLFRLGLETDFDQADDETTDPDALAAAIGAVTPPAPVESKPMVDFVEALAALKASLDKGEPLDPEMLRQVDDALNALADALGLDIDQLAVPDDFAALLDGSNGGQTGFAGALTQLLAPLAQSLDAANQASDAAGIATEASAASQLKTLGDKLGALLAAIEKGEVSADKLAALGMEPGQPLDSEIEAALNRFAAGLTRPVVPEQPVLAAPALKLNEPVLTGKSSDPLSPDAVDRAGSTAASETAAAPADKDNRDSQSSADRGRDRPEPVSREARTITAAPAPTDASNTPAPSVDAGAQQPVGARVDATANPRIIQAGYQTSQQQLNLPQIAFELARQVQDGNTRFQIRLDPPELGRIDVRLDIDKAGQINARLTVEKAETLDLMQRDQRGLERALQQAGIDSAKTNLEFSLKQNPFAGQQGQMGDGKGQAADAGASANDNGGTGDAEAAPPTVNLYRGALQASGVNIIA